MGYLVFRRDKHARTRLEADFTRFGSRIGDLAMGVDVGKGGHGRLEAGLCLLLDVSKCEAESVVNDVR